MRTLTAAFREKASGDSNKPLEAYDIFLDDTTLHLVNYDKNLDFYDVNGDSCTYIAMPISREVYERTVDNPINSVVIAAANVDRSMSSFLASNEFRGRRVVVRKIFADTLSSSGDSCTIFDGVMDAPSASEDVVKINAVDRIGTLNREAPRRWYQLLCNYKFGDSSCFFGKASGDMYGTVNATCFSGSTSSRVKSLSLSQANNYWIDGEFEMTSGQNAGLKRKIVLSSGDPAFMIAASISLPYVPVSGDSFTVRRGCDKTHFRCSGDFSNDSNWGGMDTIPQQMVIR